MRKSFFCAFFSVLLQMTAGDLKDNLKKLNNSMAFLIKHSQKLFRVIIDHTHDRTTNNKKRKLTYVS